MSTPSVAPVSQIHHQLRCMYPPKALLAAVEKLRTRCGPAPKSIPLVTITALCDLTRVMWVVSPASETGTTGTSCPLDDVLDAAVATAVYFCEARALAVGADGQRALHYHTGLLAALRWLTATLAQILSDQGACVASSLADKLLAVLRSVLQVLASRGLGNPLLPSRRPATLSASTERAVVDDPTPEFVTTSVQRVTEAVVLQLFLFVQQLLQVWGPGRVHACCHWWLCLFALRDCAPA